MDYCTIIYEDQDVIIDHLKADPYHGILYWIEDKTKIKRLDLNCQHDKNITTTTLMFENHEFGSFAILFDQYKLHVMDISANQILEADISSQRSKMAPELK